MRVENPALWWPFTHGAQPLYTLQAHLLNDHQELDNSSVRFGVRKVELIQQTLVDQDGTSFFLRLNNVPMFISGSCWIPADSLTTRVTPKKYRDWVLLARSGNQSMIRVWGGGIFERGALYDACDELGVLVWQDFMFACGNYPTHPAMLEGIKIEAEQNVSALRNHPSIVIWAGNNEDYLWVLLASLEYDPEDKDPQSWLRTNFPARYIYEHLLPGICKAMIPDIPYHPGSPFGGSTAMDPEVGDLHQWGVWHMAQAPYQEYPNLGGRFVSEFGMQALPIRRTVEDYFADPDLTERNVEGEIVRWHNKADGAEDRLKT
jgi:beta-mannosidase